MSESEQSDEGRGGYKPGWAEVFAVLGLAGAGVATVQAGRRYDRKHKMAAISDKVSYVESDKLAPRNAAVRSALAACMQYPEGATVRQIRNKVKTFEHKRQPLPVGECIRLLKSAGVLEVTDGEVQVSRQFVEELVDHAKEAPNTLRAIAIYDGRVRADEPFEPSDEFLASLEDRMKPNMENTPLNDN